MMITSIKASLLLLLFVGCASSEKPQPQASQKASSTSPRSPKNDAPVPSKPLGVAKLPTTKGQMVFVQTTVGNRVDVLEGEVPDRILTEGMLDLDQLTKKEPHNVSAQATYMGLLRIYKNNPGLYQEVMRNAGLNDGISDPWFLIEAALGALENRRYELVEYLLAKAERNFGKDQEVQLSATHIRGVKLYFQNEQADGILLMKEVAEKGYIPASMTLGFMALQSGDFKGAEAYFRKAASSRPSSVHVRLGLAASLRGQGRSDEAVGAMAAVHQAYSKDRRVTWNYILTLADGNSIQKKQAIDLLNKYFQLPGTFPEIDSKANNLLAKLQNELAQSEKKTSKP